MKKLPALALASIAAAAIAGTAIAAGAKTHVMNVPLPDGSVARIQYAGEVAPKVTVEPGGLAGLDRRSVPLAFPSLLDEMMARLNRQMQEMARQPMVAPGINVAAYGNMPAGANSTSVVSYSNGGATCTRTTQVVSQGAGKPPKVTSSLSGNCAGDGGTVAPPPPLRAPEPRFDRT